MVHLFKILNKRALHVHIARVHMKKRDYKCPLCEHTTTDKQYLKTHMKTHETEETCTKRYQCDICDKKFHHPCHLRNRAYGKLLADIANWYLSELRTELLIEITCIFILVKSLIDVTSVISHALLNQVFILIRKFMQKYPTPTKLQKMMDPIPIYWNKSFPNKHSECNF